MSRRQSLDILRKRWIGFVLLLLWPTLTRAEMPPHWVLARPQPGPTHAGYSRAVNLPAQPYPYGYFGVCSRVQWQRQFGINRNYTQWGQK